MQRGVWFTKTRALQAGAAGCGCFGNFCGTVAEPLGENPELQFVQPHGENVEAGQVQPGESGERKQTGK